MTWLETVLAAVAVGATAAALSMPSHAPSPEVLSIRFQDESVARTYWEESRSIGEKTCLTRLDDGGLPWWLHSCAQPRFTTSERDADGTMTYHYGDPQ